MITRGLPGVVALSLLLGLTLTGCDPHVGAGSATESATPSDSPSASETPTPDPSEVAESGDSGSGDTALQPHDAYARCVTLVSGALYPGETLTIAGYQDADVIPRTDGLYYIYVEVTVEGETDPEQRDVAFECILGGTFATPNDALYGKRPRAPLSDRNPDSPLSVEE